MIPSITCGIGMILVCSPLYISLPQQMQVWAERQEMAQDRVRRETVIEEESKVTQTQIEERDKVARLAARRKQAVPTRSMRLAKFEYPQDGRPGKISTRGFLSTDHIQVYDSNGKCIGDIYKRKFRFIEDYNNVCDNPPEQTTGDAEVVRSK
jgi:hypothetical protein